MIDANARWIPKGQWFFLGLDYVDNGDNANYHGLVEGDTVLCRMDTEGHGTDVQMTAYFPCGSKEIISNDASTLSWLIYAGRPEGTGFLDNEPYKAKALKALHGEWRKLNPPLQRTKPLV